MLNEKVFDATEKSYILDNLNPEDQFVFQVSATLSEADRATFVVSKKIKSKTLKTGRFYDEYLWYTFLVFINFIMRSFMEKFIF